MRTHAGKGDGESGFPAVAEKVVEVRGERDGFVSPVGQTEESSDSDATKATGVGAFGAIEPPMEFLLGAGGVKLMVGVEVVGLLVNDQPFRTMVDEIAVLIVFHRAHFDADGGNECLQGIDAFLQIAVRDEFWVLSRHQKDVSESLVVEMFGLGDHLGNGESGAEDGVIA